ncbi:MAG: TonB family protein [Rhodothermales bacterium]|nr:TonB family protein [Rhodothermales bacterium]
MVLPRLTVLNEQYAVRNVLGGIGPVDVTYLAWDLRNEEQVVVREYYPARFVTRDPEQLHVAPRSEKDRTYFQYGLERYLKEAAAMSRIEHPNVVRERAFFRENGTAYRVSDYHEGATLADVVQQQGGRIPVRTAITLIMPLLDGVRAGHKHGLIHGGITPAEIFLAKNGRPMLLSFQMTHVLLAQRSRVFDEYLKSGFAPPEQYVPGEKQGPWTDVYGCAATLYFILTGQRVPPAPARLEVDTLAELLAGQTRLTPVVREALAKGLILDSARRPQTIDAFRELLTRGAAPQAEPSPIRIPTMPDASPLSVDPQPQMFAPRKPGADVTPDGDASFAHSIFAPRTSTSPRMENGVPSALSSPFNAPMDDESSEMPEEEESRLDEESIHLELEDIEEASRALSGDGPAAPGVLPEHSLALRQPTPPRVHVEPPVFSFGDPVAPLPAHVEEEGFGASPPYQSPRRLLRVALYSVFGISIVAVLVMILMRSQGNPTAFLMDNEAYATRLAEGDSLFKLAQDVDEVGSPDQALTYYEKALEHYRVALDIEPEGSEIRDRITVVNTRLAQQAASSINEKEYLSFIADADSILRSADGLVMQGDSVRARPLYTDARRIYMHVLEFRPEDSLANARLSDTFQRQQRSRTDSQALPAPPVPRPTINNELIRNGEFYELYRAQGDSAFDTRNYRDAQRKFIEALEYRRDDEYATSMLRQIERRLSESSRDTQYSQHMQSGNEMRAANRLVEAKREFEQALEARPDDYEAKSGLFEVDLQLNQAQRREEEYLSFRARGDVLFEQGDYEGSLASYQAALAARPADDYLVSRVRETTANLEALRRLEQQLPEGMVDSNGVYNFSEEAPVLIGGIHALQSRIRYPAFAREAGVEGRITVRMIVDEAGNMQKPEVMNGLGYGLDPEVLRVLRGARFEPGRVGGKPVKVWHTLFFDFKLASLE